MYLYACAYVCLYMHMSVYKILLKVKTLTCSPPLIEMKLNEQNEGPGLAESHRAMRGLFDAKQSPCCGVGSIRSTLTMPCRQDSTSWASPVGGISHTWTPEP